MAGKDGLEVLGIFRLHRSAVDDVTGNGGRPQAEQLALELLMIAVVEEAQRAPAAGGVVNDLGHHRPVFLEEELVADTYLARRLDEHIPQAQLRVEFTQQEYLYLCVSLFLCSIQAGGEHLGIVENKSIALVEEINYVAE